MARQKAISVWLAVVVALGNFCIAGVARAQGSDSGPPAEGVIKPAEPPAEPPTEPPPAAAPAPAPANPAPAAPAASPAPAAAATPAPAPGVDPDDPEDKANTPRFRFAAHLVGGPWFIKDQGGGAGGAGLQLGIQISDMVGVYYAGTGAIGVVGAPPNGVGGGAGAFAYNSLVGELTLVRIVQFGVGPSFDSFAFGGASLSTSGASAMAISGSFFGIQGRVGAAIGGGSKPGKHGRFMIGLELHPTFIGDLVPMTAFLTLGGGSF